MRFRFRLALVLFAFVGWVGSAMADDISFNRDIRPILSDRCYSCHGFDEKHRAADLRLDIREDAEWALDPGAPDDSELIRRILSDDPDEVMPPPEAHRKAISAEEVDLLRRWIQQGASYEKHWSFIAPKKIATPARSADAVIDHFVSLGHQRVGLEFSPAALPAKWLRRVSLDLTGLPPTAAAMRAFQADVDRLGEAAYAEAVDRLLASKSFGERVAMEWLDVARYADTNGFQQDAYRMNWPWRDWVVDAFNNDMPMDQFIAEQLAGDLMTNDSSGDESESGPSQSQLIATAMNRNHMINGEGGAIIAENLAKNSFDRVETTGTAMLGLTMGCCQCHDHKFDPIKQKDYYALMSFFNQIDESGMTSRRFTIKPEGQQYAERYAVDRPFIAVASPELKHQLAEAKSLTAAKQKKLLEQRDQYLPDFVQWVKEMRADDDLQVQRIRDDYVRRIVNTADLSKPNSGETKRLLDFYLDQTKPWSEARAELKAATLAEANIQARIPLVMVMRDNKPRDTFVLLRGNYETPGEKVTPAVPDFLPPLPSTDGERPTRLDLANWLISPHHPLTSRVMVNRYWQMIFGRGLVSTPDDFGLQGAFPSHPDLLDWLAVDFQESGWNLKRLIRAMILSKTYRQQGQVTAKQLAADPDNTFLARGGRSRLDSRFLRDQTLALSGLLVDKPGGPPVAPYQPPGIWEAMSLGQNHYIQDHGDDLYRRSLYTIWRRVVAPANFFDVPSRQSCSVLPSRTSTPLHALTLLNDTTYVEAARVWAERLATIEDDGERIAEAFFAATGRDATEDECITLMSAIQKYRDRFRSDPDAAKKLIAVGESKTLTESKTAGSLAASEHAAWTNLCLLILNLDETLSK
ncbi:MAG: PSD1 and planctomycete cytochrome C domain-containing protein [Planctomycetota bacterium]